MLFLPAKIENSQKLCCVNQYNFTTHTQKKNQKEDLQVYKFILFFPCVIYI